MGPGQCALALRASQSFVSRELTERVIFVFVFLSFCLFVFLSLSFCLCQQGLAGQSPRRDSQALCLTSSGRVHVFLCDQLVPNNTSLICLLQPWRRQPFACQPKPHRAGRRIRVGLPTLGKSQKMGCTSQRMCSFPGSHNSQPRATSHCLNNRISRSAYRRSQLLLHWTSQRVDRASSSLLRTNRLHSQRTTLTLLPSSKLN